MTFHIDWHYLTSASHEHILPSQDSQQVMGDFSEYTPILLLEGLGDSISVG